MDGECAALIRGMTWDDTPLGPAETWPQSLRSALALCLSSRLPHVLHWGPEFRMLYNDDVIPIIGRHRHPSAMGQPVFEATPEGRPILEPILQRVYATGEATWTEDLMVPLQRVDRAVERYFTFTYSPVRDERGAIAGVMCAVMETTARVVELRRLRLLAALVDATRARTPNHACEMIAAQLAGEPADVPFALLYLYDRGVAVRAGLANIEHGERAPATIEYDAESDWPCERVGTCTVLPIARGSERIGFIVAGLATMTDDRDAYARFHVQLATTIAQLVTAAMGSMELVSQREELHRHFIQVPFPFAVLRAPDYVVELANAAILDAWERTESAVLGRPLFEVLPHLQEAFKPLLDRVVETGVAYVGKAAFANLRRSSGAVGVYFSVVYSPIRDSKHAVNGVLVSAFDITDQIRAEETQRSLVAFKDRFIAVLGHDLRNPLSAIDMSAHVLGLRAEKANDPAVAALSKRITSSAARMARMIGQILDLTRSQVGVGLGIDPTSQDLTNILAAVIDELRTTYGTGALSLRGTPLPGWWDRDRLEQVFSNLLGNAIDHGTAGTPIVVTASRHGDTAVIDVHNEGPPISDQVRSVLFSALRRGDRESRTPQTDGLGLGLHISHEIVAAHGGTLELLRSTPHDGTTFRVTLPIRTAA